MTEHEFILKLQERAKEQEKILNDMPFAKFFSTISLSLGKHPWRFLIPLALILSLIFRGVFGKEYTDLVLLIFRKI